MSSYRIEDAFIAEQNQALAANLNHDYEELGARLARRNVDIEAITRQVQDFTVAIPSWGVGTGGTRFARFPGIGEPRNVFEKLEDCAVIQQLGRATPKVSLHFPWDQHQDMAEVKDVAEKLGLGFDAVNSNTFQNRPDRALSYKYGSLTHTDPEVRRQAVAHNLECIELGRLLGSRALTVWIGDGGNFPGQQNLVGAFERYLDSAREIYAGLPDDWQMFIEHKLFEPAFYTTVISDWGSSYLAASTLGPKAKCLVDLGHHAPNVNIEQIVARLIHARKLAGFHFNDSKYGDDDLDTGSINPFQLFLIFNELVAAAQEQRPGFDPAYMLDQSHNVTDPVESLTNSAVELTRAYAQALLIDREALAAYQQDNDPLMAHKTLKAAYTLDVEPVLATARARRGGAIDPIATYRASGYRSHKQEERPQNSSFGSGIV